MSEPLATPRSDAVAAQKRTRTPLWIALAAFALLIIGGAVWWWMHAMRASYAYGVTTIETVSARSGAVLALTADDGVATGLLAGADGTLQRWEVSKGGDATAALADAPPVAELVTNRGAACKAISANCPPADAAITIAGLGAMTWQEEEAQWTSENGPAFDATLVYGRVDDLVIGNRTEADLAGSVDTSQIPVDSITAFDIETGETVWTKYFDHPSIVALGTKHIWAAESPLSWSELEGSDDAEATFAALVDTAERAPTVLRLGPASKANTEVFADAPEKATLAAASVDTSAPTASPTPSASPSPTPTPEPTSSETTPAVAPDAIKGFDLLNAAVPAGDPNASQPDCPQDSGYWNFDTSELTKPNFHKLPQSPDPCFWHKLEHGKYEETVGNDTWTMVDISDQSFQYADLNGDGYLDVLVSGLWGDAVGFTAVIFDPQDPEHPYMSLLHVTQGWPLELLSSGVIEVYDGEDRSCVNGRIAITGMPPAATTWDWLPREELFSRDHCLN